MNKKQLQLLISEIGSDTRNPKTIARKYNISIGLIQKIQDHHKQITHAPKIVWSRIKNVDITSKVLRNYQ